ncbi:DUF1345 domain-containing protein [Tsukamurella asaccharolytica]|uniref:DUF1345 domain-containing protein n=1 Tax=Tsukamurella asaccharolytica TaxID=2592067 RepID=UPI001315080F|nr:DUF1345 domain-containing protein [Tsukamurella asaccharolytica]
MSLVGAVVFSFLLLWFTRNRANALTLHDASVVLFGFFLVTYLLTTLIVFSTTRLDTVADWTRSFPPADSFRRSLRTEMPALVSIFVVSFASLLVASVWIPGSSESAFSMLTRKIIGGGLIGIAWACIALAFAVKFLVDDVSSNYSSLTFSGSEVKRSWSDYCYFAVSVMATFGTTDTTVNTRSARNSVAVNGCIAFLFNTVTVAVAVASLTA